MRNLDTLNDMSTDMGWPTVRHTVAGPYNCPTHDVPLVAHQLDAFNGWHELVVCPQFDGTCTYDPDGDPTAIDPPEPDKPTAEPTTDVPQPEPAAPEASFAAAAKEHTEAPSPLREALNAALEALLLAPTR